MSGDAVIGIDLGTTFSCASVYRNGRAEIIPNGDGERLIPSIVYFDPETGEASVGKIAKELTPECPSNALFDAKRFIGRKFDDEYISRYIQSNTSPFLLVRGESDGVAFQIEIAGETVIISPEEVSAEVLRYIRYYASEFLGTNVTEAVITVPAYFSNAQRKSTKKAAELAGLNVLRLISEPTAAAVHYVTDKHKSNKTILVFDFGGGTLDVSLMNLDDKTFEVKAVYGDTFLGGRDIDEVLCNHFNKPNMSRTLKRRVWNACTDLKKKLSIKEHISYCIDHCDSTGSSYTLSLTRKEFDELNKHIFKRALGIVKLCINDSGIPKSNIDEVVLVGGTTRIPKVRDILSTFFEKSLTLDLNPDEAVAAGASIQAALLKDNSGDLERYKVTEVTPLSLGYVSKTDYMTIVIPRNSPLPANETTFCSTVFNDQEAVRFEIKEGERKKASLNNTLGTLEISGLPRKRAGDVHFETEFYLDEDGILNITAYETSTGKTNKLSITMGEFRLSEKRIQISLHEARNQKTEDDIFEAFNDYKNNCDTTCQHILYDLNKISTDKDRDFVKKNCSEFTIFAESLKFTEIDKLESRFLLFQASVIDILKRNSMLSIQFEKPNKKIVISPLEAYDSDD